jgi:hypothetical protein
MIIYHVKAWDKPVDYAASSREVSLGLYMTREGAEKKIKEFKKQKDWKAWWDLPTIQEVEVLP